MSPYSKQVGLIGHDLLHAQRPLLIEGARQAERLVPGRQLHRAGSRALREHHREHLDENARDVVFRLLFGEAERIDLHAIAEPAQLLVRDAVALEDDFVPKLGEGAHFAQFGDETHSGVDEKGNASNDLSEILLREFAGLLNVVEHRDGRRQRIGELLDRRRAGLLQMIGADVYRIEFGRLLGREQDQILRQPQRRPSAETT